MATGLIRTAAHPVVIDRAVYGTITLTSVLIVYDGWAKLKLLDVLVIILGPAVAMSLGHAFASTLARQAELGRPLTNAERLEAVRYASWNMLLAVPPVVLVVVMTLAGVALGTTIQVVVWLAAASLGFWGGLAAHRAGLRGRRLVLSVVAGLIVGGAVLVLQVALQPGKAVSDGVAARFHPHQAMAWAQPTKSLSLAASTTRGAQPTASRCPSATTPTRSVDTAGDRSTSAKRSTGTAARPAPPAAA